MYNNYCFGLTLLLAILAELLSNNTFAQNATLYINESTLRAGSSSITASGYNYQTGLGLFPTLYLKTSGNTLNSSTGASIPVDRIMATVVKDNVDRTTIHLSPNDQVLNGSLLGLLSFSSGPFSMRYAASNLSAYAWTAGNYNTTLNFRVEGLAIGASITPNQATLNVVVSPFIAYTVNPTDISVNINSFDYFRNGYTSSSLSQISLLHTLPLYAYLSTSTNQFIFSNGYNNVVPPLINTSTVQYQIYSPQIGAAIALDNTAKAIYSNSSVPNGNSTALNQRLTISAADMQQYFVNKGNYTTTLNFRMSDKSSSPTVNQLANANLTINVADLGELRLNTAAVKLTFENSSNYLQGVYTDVANQLTISKTTPYDLSVKAQSAYFTMGQEGIPVNVLSIGPAVGQLGMQTVESLSTQSQSLISAGIPTIDRNLSLRYRIPATKTAQLLGKPQGTYTATITYTLTAH